MWTRKELKEKGKITFKRNYWKCVLAAIIACFVLGGYPGALGGGFANKHEEDYQVHSNIVNDLNGDVTGLPGNASEYFRFRLDINNDGIPEITDISDLPLGVGIAMGVGIILAVILVTAIVLVLEAFIINPLELGCDRFFYKNLDEKSDIAEIAYGFDHGYGNIVRIMFRRDIYLILWTLLFIIPGIVKSYEYRMIPYLLAERPDMDPDEAFKTSKMMMSGQKWKTFVLDLSFLGWEILSLLTIGILGLFYVNPYRRATCAALYEHLRINTQLTEIEEA
ncbi:MAG: DUF975 family protein [Lachnospiraceae bacterium]|nr:DUF975 family protein [Lachnospiraceae bacterium]